MVGHEGSTVPMALVSVMALDCTKFRTLVIAPECTWCSCHSPGTVSGNFMARRVPELVPAKSIRPERDITHCVNTISLAGTSRRICGQRMFHVMFHFR